MKRYTHFFFSSRRRHTRSVSAFLLNRSSDLIHPLTSDVRDEFVSVTEKLMDELAQCYNVLPQLRSEERRVGKECRSRWSSDHEKKKGKTMLSEPATIDKTRTDDADALYTCRR